MPRSIYLLIPFVFFLAGCIPSPISVGPTGKIALCLNEHGEYSMENMKPGFDLFITDMDGSFLKKVTNDSLWNGWPAWSPDGKRLLFTSQKDEASALFVCDESGENIEQIIRDPGGVMLPAWSPDGKWIAFLGRSDTGLKTPSLKVCDPKSKETRTLAERVAWRFTWSPDSKTIVYPSPRCVYAQIDILSAFFGDLMTVGVEKGDTQNVASGFFPGGPFLCLEYSRDGRNVYWSSFETKMPFSTLKDDLFSEGRICTPGIHKINLDTGEIYPMKYGGPHLYRANWSLDGGGSVMSASKRASILYHKDGAPYFLDDYTFWEPKKEFHFKTAFAEEEDPFFFLFTKERIGYVERKHDGSYRLWSSDPKGGEQIDLSERITEHFKALSKKDSI